MRRARDAAGLTQGELADRLGVSRSTLVSYEQGETGLLVDRLAAIERAIGLTPDALAYPPPKSETTVVAADLDQFLRERAEGEDRGRAAAEALRSSEGSGSRATRPVPRATTGSVQR